MKCKSATGFVQAAVIEAPILLDLVGCVADS